MPAHRESISAPGAPEAVGPYVHAVRTPASCCSARARSRSIRRPATSSARPRPTRPGAAWRTSPRSAMRPGPRLGDAVRLTVYLTDMACVRVGQRGVRVVLRVRSAGAGGDRGGGRCRAARRWRSTRWWRSLTDTAHGRAPHAGSSSAMPPCGRCAGVVRETPVLSSRTLSERAGGTVVAEDREPAADRIVQAPRRVDQARCAGRRLLPPASSPAAPATMPRRSRTPPARGACRCVVFMPEAAPIAKVEAAAALGAQVQHGRPSGRRRARGRSRPAAEDERMAFVHPFEDPT